MNIRLTPPEKFQKDVKLWVDEAIWGHRLHNDQTPWLVLLEFLAIFQSRQKVGKALNEDRKDGAHESFTYYIPKLIPIRELIFNNPFIRFVEETKHSDSERWKTWLNEFDIDNNFSYLKDRFESFEHLARVIEFFQSTAIEPHRQRRWSSRFLFPYGPQCLYADLPPNTNKSPDRRFFARSGELLYLMLNRSGKGIEIAKKISDKLLRDDEIWNRVVNALLPDDYQIDSNSTSSRIGYLPFSERHEYRELAKTWLQILELDLPGEALFDPLMRLSSLHILLYMLGRANEEVNDNSPPKFVLHIESPQKTTIFELSKENFGANRMLSSRAVRAYVDAAKNTEEWDNALKAKVPNSAIYDYLKNKFKLNNEEHFNTGLPEDIFNNVKSAAEDRHLHHVAKVHMEWAKQIGLVISRRGAGTWYSPDDSLLKALVMCTVNDGREEYHHFLSNLYKRFRFVIGASEAEQAFDGSLPTDQHAFTQNTHRLEERLRTLGLLRRLSDDCAYVINPFRSNS